MPTATPQELAALTSEEPPAMSSASVPAPMPDAVPQQALPSFIPARAPAAAVMPPPMPDAVPQGGAAGLPSFIPGPAPAMPPPPSPPLPTHGLVGLPTGTTALAGNPQLLALAQAQQAAGMNDVKFAPGAKGAPATAAAAAQDATSRPIPAAIAKAYGTAVAAGASPQNALAAAYATNKKDNDASFDKERDALERSSMAQAGAEVQKQDAFAKQAEDLEAEKQAQAQAAQRQQQAQQQQIQAIKQAQAQAMAQKIDPDHFFATRTQGQRTAIAIGAALGGLMQGLQGGKSNSFMDAINQSIDTDIKAQKANIDQKWEGVKAHQQVYEAMHQAGVDQANADIVKKGLMLDAVKAKVESLSAGQQSAAVQGRAAQMIGALDREKAALDLQATATPIIAQQRAAAAAAAASAAKGPQYNHDDESADQARYVPYAGGLAKDAKSASELNSATAALDSLKRNVEEVKAIRAKLGAAGLAAGAAGHAVGYDTEAFAKLGVLRGRIINDYNAAANAGVVSDKEFERAAATVGDPTGFLNSNETRLEQLVHTAKGSLDEHIKAHGIQQVERRYARDAGGTVRPVLEYTGRASASPKTAMPKSFKPVGSDE